MSNSIDKLKNRLKKALKYANMKPIELSEKTGIPKSSISQYMSGYAQPNTSRLYLICKALNVSEAWLMGFDVPMERISFLDTEQAKKNDILSDIIIRLRTDKKFFETVSILYNLPDELLDMVLDFLNTPFFQKESKNNDEQNN